VRFLNFGKVLNLIAQNNIDPEKVFEIVEKVKNADLKDENTIRGLIKEISVLANKQIDKEQENKLVKKILNDGVNEDLFDMI
jgi:hypothetical protein